MADLLQHDAVALGELTRRGEITPLELLEDTIARIGLLNPELKAVIHTLYDHASESAKYWTSRIESGTADDAWVVRGGPSQAKKGLTGTLALQLQAGRWQRWSIVRCGGHEAV